MRHTPFFCEENVWHLARDADVRVEGVALPEVDRWIVFVTNRGRTVSMWAQHAGDPVVWDYHVVLLARGRAEWWILDADSTLGFPLRAAAWLSGSFHPTAPPSRAPRFRVVEATAFEAAFASDRSHMREPDGRESRPHPPWPLITSPMGAHTLPRFLDEDDAIAGSWFDLAAMQAHFAPDGL